MDLDEARSQGPQNLRDRKLDFHVAAVLDDSLRGQRLTLVEREDHTRANDGLVEVSPMLGRVDAWRRHLDPGRTPGRALKLRRTGPGKAGAPGSAGGG